MAPQTSSAKTSSSELKNRKQDLEQIKDDEIEITSDEEAELLKEEEEEEKKKMLQAGYKPPQWTESFWIKCLGLAFPILLSLGDVVLFVFEYLFTNTIVQTLLASVSFHKYRSFSSIHKCDSCKINLDLNSTVTTNTEAFSAFNEVMNMDWKSCLTCVFSEDASLIMLNFLYVAVWSFCICYYFTWRYGVKLGKIRKPSAKAILVILTIIIGMVLLVWYQYQNNEWIYSMSNFTAIKRDTKNPFGFFGNETEIEAPIEDDITSFVSETETINTTIPNLLEQEGTQVDYLKMIQLMIGSPIVEEIILRVVLVHMFFRRTGRPVVSFVMTNTLFAVLHMFSVNWGASYVYTYYQVLAGFVLGMFYSTRYYLTENLAENALLHIANNVSAIFLPVTLTFDDIYPKYVIPGKFLIWN